MEDFERFPTGAQFLSAAIQGWLQKLGLRQNIDLQQELTSVASGDELLVFDVSETGNVKTKKATVANIGTTIAAAGLAGSFSTLTATGLVDISGASAGQIKFPATQNASSNANTLDDYEEGTWSPTVGGTSTYTVQSGRYTKIGRLVMCEFDFTINALGTGSTTVLSGLPFANGALQGGMTVGYFQGLAVTVYSLGGTVAPSATAITMTGITGAGGAAVTAAIPAIFGNGARLLGNLSYSV